MIYKDLYKDVPGITGIKTINISDSYGQSSAVATIVCESTTKLINEMIAIDMGYTDAHGSVFSGRIKNIARDRDDGIVTIIAKDIMIDAADFFMVSDNPEEPFKWNNISAEDLIGALLAMAGITNYSPNVPLSFTFAVNAPAEFNLISVSDACSQIAGILAWHVYADGATVRFEDIRPYYRTGAQKDTDYGQSGNPDDIISHRICTDGSITGVDVKAIMEGVKRTFSDEGIRNKVVVYGRDTIKAVAKTTSPYLPAGFYKAAVIASPLIDSGTMAQAAADYNLSLFNRPTDIIDASLTGDYTIKARQFIEFSDTFLQVSGGTAISRAYFVQSVQHSMGPEGFTTRVTCSK